MIARNERPKAYSMDSMVRVMVSVYEDGAMSDDTMNLRGCTPQFMPIVPPRLSFTTVSVSALMTTSPMVIARASPKFPDRLIFSRNLSRDRIRQKNETKFS